VNGSSAAKADTAHTHAATDIVSGTLDNARTSGTASATASTLVLRDGSGGASFGYVAANNQLAYLDSHFQSFECGAFQTVGGPFENMAKYSEDFTAATWDKKWRFLLGHRERHRRAGWQHDRGHHHGGDRDADHPEQVAGLASGGQYTFYVWAKVASGTKQVSIAIVDNAYAGYLARPDEASRSRRRGSGSRSPAAGGRADRPLDRRAPVRRERRQLDQRRHLPVGRVPAAGQRPEERVRPHLGVADCAGRGRSCVRRDRDRRQGQLGVAAPDLRSWLESRRTTRLLENSLPAAN